MVPTVPVPVSVSGNTVPTSSKSRCVFCNGALQPWQLQQPSGGNQGMRTATQKRIRNVRGEKVAKQTAGLSVNLVPFSGAFGSFSCKTPSENPFSEPSTRSPPCLFLSFFLSLCLSLFISLFISLFLSFSLFFFFFLSLSLCLYLSFSSFSLSFFFSFFLSFSLLFLPFSFPLLLFSLSLSLSISLSLLSLPPLSLMFVFLGPW